MAKKHLKKPALASVPRTETEADTLVSRIGNLQRQVTDIETQMNAQLAEIKERHAQTAGEVNAEIESLFEALHAWAAANRDTLCPGRAKTAKLPSGELSWRVAPPSVRITQPDVVVERLKAAGLTEFVRTKEDVDKTRVLAQPERVEHIKGIAIVQTEQFIVRPFETDIERVLTVRAA